VIYFKAGMVTHARAGHLVGEMAIQEILRWSKGKFVFVPNEETTENTVGKPIQFIILEAARRIDEWQRIEKVIPSLDLKVKIVEVPDASIENINLRPEEWKILSFVDSQTTIKGIAQKANLSDFDTAKILFGLVSSGLVRIIKEEKHEASEKKDESVLKGIIKKIKGD
ncbi:MAG: DUF4388 domain-containing protein, partial [candidate division WOR-3 bacterium]